MVVGGKIGVGTPLIRMQTYIHPRSRITAYTNVNIYELCGTGRICASMCLCVYRYAIGRCIQCWIV